MTTPGGDGRAERPERQTEVQLGPCWHCGNDVTIDTADVVITNSGLVWVCVECQT